MLVPLIPSCTRRNDFREMSLPSEDMGILQE